ncbi:hypothetical protein COU77_00760 [Candidatus Peregrinibacteria bacterium CG10_big_fil_rev_8_21_14_0_10_49_16]|nr:MAG: hypothetical protein COW95_03020 [Candidatus Peregrinibacteria bacterium CG22_combo_CG10-13_8_21_14_all_49_11]PIR52357.1 MAG: hypothetical protein COU77_00760 [Candidatus Peregrinibacteria bacterium CG10_big_fil_rev_8_21_14_0_10_49_16]
MVEEVYRNAASVFLLRGSEACSPDGCGDVLEVLLLHKPRKNDAWQLPQGGVEKGESVRDAAMRELQEEAGVMPMRVLGESHTRYSYDFPESYRRFRADHIRGQDIHFVLAVADACASISVDGHEIDQYVWVGEEQLSSYIVREEYLAVVRTLFGEAATLLSSAL